MFVYPKFKKRQNAGKMEELKDRIHVKWEHKMYTHTVEGKRVITRSKLGSRNDKLEKSLVKTKRQYNPNSLLHYMQVKLSGSVPQF